jgi:hypothetical protein
MKAVPSVLGILHRAGVQGTRFALTSAGSGRSDHREIISLQILLEDPQFLLKLAAAANAPAPVPR